MKSKLIILMFFSINIVLFSNYIAKNGILDLSNFDFETNEYVLLNGEWEFYWNKAYCPSDFQENPNIKDNSLYKIVPFD